MKCQLKYRWVKLPRACLPQGKGVLGQWARLAARDVYKRQLLESFGELQALQKKIHDRLKSVLGLETKVTLVSPKSLERFQGKAKRVLDLRNQPEE